MNDGPYRILGDQETAQLFETLWERTCLEQGINPLRPDGKDSMAQIQYDFPSLFGLDQSS